jgi:DNA mismatch endonuclease (patch repair protein)
MADIVSPQVRSRMMRSIRGRDTHLEKTVRSILHRGGFRFRLQSDLPGRPDIVLPRYRTCLFVHGCFWHRHPHCRLAAIPATRTDFWQAKFSSNVARDLRNVAALRQLGWRVIIVWECGVRRSPESLGRWLASALPDQGAEVLEWPPDGQGRGTAG